MERQAESAQLPVDKLSENDRKLNIESPKFRANSSAENNDKADDSTCEKPNCDSSSEEKKEVQSAPDIKFHRVQLWMEIRPSLRVIEDMTSACVKKNVNSIKNEVDSGTGEHLPTIEETRPGKGAPEEDSDEEFYDLERSESILYYD